MGYALLGVLLAGIAFWVLESVVVGMGVLWRGVTRPLTHFSVPCPVCGASNAFEHEEAARSVVSASKSGAMEKLIQKARPCRNCRADLVTTWRTHPAVHDLVARAEAHRGTAEDLSTLYGPQEELPDPPEKKPPVSRSRAKARKRTARPKKTSWWS